MTHNEYKVREAQRPSGAVGGAVCDHPDVDSAPGVVFYLSLFSVSRSG